MTHSVAVPLKNVLGLDYEPHNEAGVIILFTLLMKDLGFSGVSMAQGKFPDCIARRGNKSVLIEFEYKSINFVLHNHKKDLGRRNCTIVCWEDNWKPDTKNISIICLSKYLRLSRRVRLAHVKAKEDIFFLDSTNRRTTEWSMPANTRKGDLVLVWRCGRGQSKFQDIFLALEDASPKRDYSGYGKCKIICHLNIPITLYDIRNHQELSKSAMSRSGFFMGSNKELTQYWHSLYHIILDRNPGLARSLKPFRPGEFTI